MEGVEVDDFEGEVEGIGAFETAVEDFREVSGAEVAEEVEVAEVDGTVFGEGGGGTEGGPERGVVGGGVGERGDEGGGRGEGGEAEAEAGPSRGSRRGGKGGGGRGAREAKVEVGVDDGRMGGGEEGRH